jgi:hypothetical protein
MAARSTRKIRFLRILAGFTFARLCTLLSFIAIGITACLMPAQSDTWWQLRSGMEIWRTGSVDLHDHFSHTVFGGYWPNHEWLSQLIFFAVHRVGGMPLLTTACAATIVAAWAIVWRLSTGVVMQRVIVLGLAVLGSSHGWTLRPQVFTLLLCAATAYLLVRRRDVLLPPLFLLWANLHGGVVLGFVILAGALADRTLNDRRNAWRLVAVTAACAAATILTPLGLSFWSEIPASLARLREYQILEWRPPRVADPLFLPFWLIAAAIVPLAFRRQLWRRQAGRSHTLEWSALALLPLALSSARNIPPFLLIAFPAVTAMWLAEFPAQTTKPATAREKPAVNAAVFAVTAALALMTIAYSWTAQIPRLGWHPLEKQVMAAIDSCPERLYNRYDDGGYLIWFMPQRKVFMDSRQDPFPKELVRAHIEAETSGEYGALFNQFEIQCAFVPADSLVAQRLRTAGWVDRYHGPTWSVLAR